MPFLLGAMGPFKICMLMSVVLAVFSAIASIMAYTNVYEIANEILSKLSSGEYIDGEYIVTYGKSIVFMVCMGYGLYGMSLLFSHGGIAERGNHESLLALGGTYSRMVALQGRKNEGKEEINIRLDYGFRRL